MYEVRIRIFSELPSDTIGEFESYRDAQAFAMDRFQFGAEMWIEEDGFVMLTARELELRFQTDWPLA